MNADERAIRDLVALWHRATAAGEVGTVLALIAEDVVFLVAGQPPMKGREAFERGLRDLLAQHRIESTGDVQEVQVSGNFAWCWTKLTVRVVPRNGGSATNRAGSTLSIFRKQSNGSWVLMRDANLLTQVS